MESYKNCISEMNLNDPKVHFKVDIGLPIPQRDRKMETSKRIEYIKKVKCNSELEKLSRNNECKCFQFSIIDINMLNIKEKCRLGKNVSFIHYYYLLV